MPDTGVPVVLREARRVEDSEVPRVQGDEVSAVFQGVRENRACMYY